MKRQLHRPSTEFDRLEFRATECLNLLLRTLASSLMDHGITLERFSELSTHAFVRAAAETAKLQNGKVNQSRVAAQTGLPRAAVKSWLNHRVETVFRRAASPVENVYLAWQADPEFTSRRGRPRALTISGSRGSFVRLARRHAGDVPYRAVLDELRRVGAIRELRNGRLQLRVAALRAQRDLGYLSRLVPLIQRHLAPAGRKKHRRTGKQP
jgi:hypothetical protein